MEISYISASMSRKYLIISFFLLFLAALSPAQDNISLAEACLEERGELIIEFANPGREILVKAGSFISIDNVSAEKVRAYINKEGFYRFLELNIDFSVLKAPSLDAAADVKGGSFFEQYPSYDQYDSIMRKFAEDYPLLCTLDTIGYSVQDRLLLVLKLSDNVGVDESEPEFYYTSTMHGDETLGFMLMLRLIDHLLSNYASDIYITSLLNSIELYINPLANPDGFYRDGGPSRFNASNVDLNRNFPDPWNGPHPDGKDYAPENTAQMDFMRSRHFVMSANFHSGAEVVNYPWDNWTSYQKIHPDDSWLQFVSHEYADTVHQYSTGYMTGFDSGVTNGGDWYVIDGGRQDYVTYFLSGREVTIELDNTKITPVSQLNEHWEYNYRSLINYACQAGYGVQGQVSDSSTGMPLKAMIKIAGHDHDSSMVFSEAGNGFYVRLLDEGIYDITFSAPGYFDTVITDISVLNYHSTILNVKMLPLAAGVGPLPEIAGLRIFPNPVSSGLSVDFSLAAPGELVFTVYSMSGRMVFVETKYFREGDKSHSLHFSGLPAGIYFLHIEGPSSCSSRKFIKDSR